MTFKPVNEVPNKKRAAKHNLKGLLKEFVDSDKKIVQIVFVANEYKYPLYAYKSLLTAVRRYKVPVSVHYRDGEVYLAKK